jgi:hypothetical protein
MEWFSDRHGSNLGTDLLGEEDALLDGLGGEVRPVGRDQDVLPIRRPDWALPTGAAQ